jgi:lipopolysaccharide/colanic/teichoic acid biosynthesis glycosyltransferase
MSGHSVETALPGHKTQPSGDYAAIPSPNKRRLYFTLKRSLDVVLASFLLLILAPFLLVVFLLIKLDSPGPVIFSQERAGVRRRTLNGQTGWEPTTFRVYKFRTMYHAADSRLHEDHVRAFVEGRLASATGARAKFKLRDDPRVTRVGSVLRRLSMDELPQLANVLAGDMSLVGPRPVPLYERELYDAEQAERFAALPGITGLWQVSGRCDVPFEEMIRLDIEYVRRQSLLLDLKILVRTIPAVLSARGAG